MAVPMNGKTVLVTGGARRIGQAIVRRLHDAGANLVIHHRTSSEQAQALEAELNRRRAHSAALLRADLMQTRLLDGLIAEAAGAWGRLDALVNLSLIHI